MLFLELELVSFSLCSVGDRSSDFRSCTSRCSSHFCSDPNHELPFALRLTRWTCYEDCQYQCMHEVTAQDIALSRPVRQFFGKWPFVRVLGIQEPASALFSVLNGVTAAIGFFKFQQQASAAYPFHKVLLVQFLVTINAWMWSTVFHVRDFNWTEKLDYFSAAFLVVVGLVAQFVRISGPTAAKWHIVYCGVWLVLLCCHVTYLSVFKFDYGYNMAACIAAGALYSAIWIIWCIKNGGERSHYTWKCAATVMAASCFVLLELLDFAPLWWTFDAHSLWHLSTVPLPLMWYSFLADDAEYEVQTVMRKHV